MVNEFTKEIYAKKQSHVKTHTVIARFVHSMEGTGVLSSNVYQAKLFELKQVL